MKDKKKKGGGEGDTYKDFLHSTVSAESVNNTASLVVFALKYKLFI